MPPTREPAAENERSTARRVGALLDLFLRQGGEHGVTELAAQLTVSKSVMHRMVTALAAEGIFERDPVSRKYRLGPSVLSAMQATSRIGGQIARRAWVFMDALTSRTGETAVLSLLVGSRMRVHVQQTPGTGQLQALARIGVREPLYDSASGLAMLAYFPRDIRVAVVEEAEGKRLGDGSQASVVELTEQLRTIRKRGYALHGFAPHGIFAVASPVFDELGNVVAALGVLCFDPTAPGRSTTIGAAVREEARRLSRALGSPGPRAQ